MLPPAETWPEPESICRKAQENTSGTGSTVSTYLWMRGSGGAVQAGTVAFASVVANQLAQTLDLGWVEESLSRSVAGAVAGSAGLLVSALTVRPVRDLLGLVTPTPLGWGLIGGSALAAVAINRVLSASERLGPTVSSIRALLPEGRVPMLGLAGPGGSLAVPAEEDGRKEGPPSLP